MRLSGWPDREILIQNPKLRILKYQHLIVKTDTLITNSMILLLPLVFWYTDHDFIIYVFFAIYFVFEFYCQVFQEELFMTTICK